VSEKASKSRQSVDWERIEVLYRAGTISVREIAAEFGISHTAINKRAKLGEWERDLTAKIKAKADAKVSKAEVSRQVSEQTKITEAVRIEIESEVQARIQITHRADVPRARALVSRLIAECEAMTIDPELFSQLGEIMRSPDDKGADKLNDLYKAVCSFPGRVKSTKELIEALRVAVELERKVFGIDAAIDVDDSGKPRRELTDAERSTRLARMLMQAAKAKAEDAHTSP
jgi:DNA-binding Lrp family transcriptional regulator